MSDRADSHPPADDSTQEHRTASASEAERRLETLTQVATAPAKRTRGGAEVTADRVGTIVAAAEQAADALRVQAESRMQERIAEGQRAAENRVTAAEDEAAEIIKAARDEGARAKTVAASEALSILAKAHDEADRTRKEAEEVKTAAISEARRVVATANQEARDSVAKAKAQSLEIIAQARIAAADVRAEGMELVSNLREMGGSLRSNSERLLRDVQAIHSHMVAELDRVDGGATAVPSSSASARESGARRRGRDLGRSGTPDADELEVPEFIPPG